MIAKVLNALILSESSLRTDLHNSILSSRTPSLFNSTARFRVILDEDGNYAFETAPFLDDEGVPIVEGVKTPQEEKIETEKDPETVPDIQSG